MILDRSCATCEKQLEIVVDDFDRSYTGGHYFGVVDINDSKSEYWECDACYCEEGDELDG